MGRLNPGATYIYERVNGTVFAREFGSDERIIVGQDFNSNDAAMYQRIATDYIEDKLWQDIRETAETNPALQEALERVKILYHLSKNDEQ
jgi:hypothetical protein